MSYESRRYETVEQFRVGEVQEAFFYRREPLLRSEAPWQIDEGFKYSKASLPKVKSKSIDELLEETRKVLDG